MKNSLSAYALVAVALVASLMGGAVGAYVSTSVTRGSADSAPPVATPAVAAPAAPVAQSPAPTDTQTVDPSDEVAELDAEATPAAPRARAEAQVATARPVARAKSKKQTRRVYYSSDSQQAAPARSYYEYKKPSFWSRHRDLMTIAIGTGVGTGIGAIAGGGKGAAIGALAGGGGTGVYTLVRKRRQQ